MNLNGSAGLPNFPYKLYGHQAPVDFEFSSFSIIFPVPGFLIKPINGQKGCEVGYVTHTNPRGKIPTWLTNKVTSYVAPRMLRKLHKACIQVNNLQKSPFIHHFIQKNGIFSRHSSINDPCLMRLLVLEKKCISQNSH